MKRIIAAITILIMLFSLSPSSDAVAASYTHLTLPTRMAV